MDTCAVGSTLRVWRTALSQPETLQRLRSMCRPELGCDMSGQPTEDGVVLQTSTVPGTPWLSGEVCTTASGTCVVTRVQTDPFLRDFRRVVRIFLAMTAALAALAALSASSPASTLAAIGGISSLTMLLFDGSLAAVLHRSEHALGARLIELRETIGAWPDAEATDRLRAEAASTARDRLDLARARQIVG